MFFPFLSYRSAGPILALAALAACSDPKNPTPVSNMSWTIEGKTVRADSSEAFSYGGSLFIIGYYTRDAETSTVFLNLPAQTGTSSLIPIGQNVKAIYHLGPSLTSGTTYQAITGTATVTSFTDSTAVGTFSFDASDGSVVKSITNGKFNVK